MLALSSCGLESFILLSPPVGVNVGDSLNSTFQFRATSDNSEIEFLGFEVYYKIFLTSDTPINYYNTFDDLVAASYHRLNDSNKDRPGIVNMPLVFVDIADRGDVFDIYISFLVVTSVFPQLTVAGASGPATTTQIDALRRSLANSTSTDFKRYNEFVEEDVSAVNTDVSQSIFDAISSTPHKVLITCFAVSFGNDTGLKVYSQPVWLGNKEITIPYS